MKLAAALLPFLLAVAIASAQLQRPPQDEVIYQIMPIAWCDSNNDFTGGVNTRFGDFGGLASNTSLDYLQYLGVTMVYLQPIFPSAAYHGYQHGPADTLNSRFGTEAQFLDFVQKAHARGIKVILDFVAYGISQNSTYFQSAYLNPLSQWSSWLAFTNSGNSSYVGSYYNTWNGAGVGFIHWNLNNASAVTTVTNYAKHWLDPNGDGNTSDGVDGFRLDHAWASGGEGWGANISFWETWCSSLRTIRPDVFIFCEPSDWGNYGTDLLTPGAFDAVITKPFEFAARSAVMNKSASGLYSSVATTVAAIPAGKFAVPQTSDHDSNRLASDFGGSTSSNNARMKVAAALLLTQPGVPNIYYGDELGMKGAKANVGSDANDIPMREPFKWKAVAGAPMTNYAAVSLSPQPPTYAANNDGRSVDEQKGVAGSLLETYRSLIAARKGSIALRRGGYTPVACSLDGVYAFVRSDAAETVLVAINLDSATANGTLNMSSFTVPTAGTIPVDIQTSGTLTAITTANKGAYPIQLAARSWFIARAALTPPQDIAHADIDGRNLPSDAGDENLIATQSCLSSLGDNAGELDQLFARRDGDALRVSISGNLPSDGTPLALFIDVDPGSGLGQSTLATGALGAPPQGLALLDGLDFDTGFAPDTMYFINTVGSTLWVDHVDLPDGALAIKDYRGSVGVNTGHGVLAGGVNPNNIEVALDNSNTAGITAGSVTSAASATKGMELRIPLAELGLASDFNGFIALSACLERADGTITNQWLPGLAGGSGELGVAPDLRNVSGLQHALVSMGRFGDLDGNGNVDGGDLGLILLDFGPCPGCVTDLDRSGSVDGGDVGLVLLNFD
ncbi:MAG: hypothetical protein K8R92_11780 [Planctomycetes bacterium]|nr:hypothetical protein [Planctomycetota bacterium]